MSTSTNPLQEMASMAFKTTDEVAPDDTFTDTALPGFKQTVTARRSIRIFDREPIPEEVMRDCLRDAILAPSSSNLQPYELYWVRDSTKRKRLGAACLGQPAAKTAGEIVVVVARRDLWKTNLDKVWDLMTEHGHHQMPA